ncbi:S8 family serine peptidase [Mycoplasma sp. E35C]|uniref:S8 family serine peptidase n=1 Tax=Mycoplasma sp. E35C TaxID=2801918 RepID=UPI001CA3BB5A|nr:S8 family serine peptidase [Mycoplasma sp. E35C]QZX49493.1 S8 family serine peptidase [Mycoplasma sp. E35C]
MIKKKILKIISSISFSLLPFSALSVSNLEVKKDILNEENNEVGKTILQNTSLQTPNSFSESDQETKTTYDNQKISKQEINKKTVLIEIKRDISPLNVTSLVETLKNETGFLFVKKSEAIKSLILAYVDEQQINKVTDFLNNSSWVENFSFDNNKKGSDLKPNNSEYYGNITSNNSSKYGDYSQNFISNKYEKKFRDEAIRATKRYENAGNSKIAVAVLEVGGKEDITGGLIDNTNRYYFNSDSPVENNNSLFYNINTYFWSWPTYSEHATQVGSIIGGRSGVNPLLKLYGIKYNGVEWGNDIIGLDNEIGYILSHKDIKVVNNSHGAEYGKGKYTYNIRSRYIDLVAHDNPDFVFVFSAGNDGDENNKKLNNMQLSHNSIIVGSNDKKGSISSFSSQGSDTSNSPLLLANGERYNFENRRGYGTSYSAPFISGVVANTMILYKEKYQLGRNGIIAKAALGSATSNVSSNTNGQSNLQSNLNKDFGAGILDYSKLKESFDNLRYIKWKNYNEISLSPYTSYDKSSNELIIKNKFFKKGDILRTSLSWSYNGRDFFKNSKPTRIWQNVYRNENDIKNPAIKDFDLKIRNTKGQTIQKSEGYNNYEFIKVKIPEDGYYDFVISRYSDSLDKTSQEELAFTYTTER